MGFNLLPWRERKKRKNTLFFIAYFLIGITLCITIILFYQHHLKNSIMKEKLLYQKLSIKQKKLSGKNDYAASKKYSEQEKLIRQFEKNKQSIEKIMVALQVIASSAPKNAYLTNIQFKKEKIEIKGIANHLTEIDQFAKNMGKYHRFSSVSLKKIIQKNDVYFEIEIYYD